VSKSLAALIAGVVFGTGLSISGMTDPQVVLAFLTLNANWDPSLMLVMVSAIAVTALGYRAATSRIAPLFDSEFHRPVLAGIDRRLVLGAVVFGTGWGLVGYCPGPAIVGALTLDPRALAFLPGFVAALLAFEIVPKPTIPQLDDA
jgi:uncharacterized membrane protein YedE/YeeE